MFQKSIEGVTLKIQKLFVLLEKMEQKNHTHVQLSFLFYSSTGRSHQDQFFTQRKKIYFKIVSH